MMNLVDLDLSYHKASVKLTESLVFYKHQRSNCLTFDLKSKATHIRLPYMYLSIFFSEFIGLFELKFHMEYSVDKTIKI